MKVTRTSIQDGKTHTLDLPITPEQIRAFKNGALIQNAFPHLTPDQREFILTGITPSGWAALFCEPENN